MPLHRHKPKKRISPARKRTNRMNKIDKAAGGIPRRLKRKKKV